MTGVPSRRDATPTRCCPRAGLPRAAPPGIVRRAGGRGRRPLPQARRHAPRRRRARASPHLHGRLLALREPRVLRGAHPRACPRAAQRRRPRRLRRPRADRDARRGARHRHPGHVPRGRRGSRGGARGPRRRCHGPRRPRARVARGDRRSEPAEERVDVDLVYASRHVRLPEDGLRGDRMLLSSASAERPTALFVFPQEGGRYIVSTGGFGAEHHPPADQDALLEYAAAAAPDDLRDVVREAEPTDDRRDPAVPVGRAAALRPARRDPGGPRPQRRRRLSSTPPTGRG